MRILALESYYGGSHKAFLDSWIEGSDHRWTLLTLPPFKWKWRMRHGALTFVDEVARRSKSGEAWDAVFCSDMLDLAAFRGLAPNVIHRLPTVVYFHENQLTYPVQVEKERDFHFGLTNLTTALAADEVWFNSAFHRNELLGAIPRMLKRMPDFRPLEAVEKVCCKSHIHPQGILGMPRRASRRPGPLRILWAARWEFDKGPEAFFAALSAMRQAGVEFRVSVLGESFRRVPDVFARAREAFAEHIDLWGFQASRDDYVTALVAADVFVSTAEHEFFGVSAVEAIAAGCYPILPKRLAYPEILAGTETNSGPFFYDGTVQNLAERLIGLAHRLPDLWQGDPQSLLRAVARFDWRLLGPVLDSALESVTHAES